MYHDAFSGKQFCFRLSLVDSLVNRTRPVMVKILFKANDDGGPTVPFHCLDPEINGA